MGSMWRTVLRGCVRPHGEFYAAMHPKGVPLDSEFSVVQIDLANRTILGTFEVRSHELAVMPDGTLLPATRGTQLVLLKPRQQK